MKKSLLFFLNLPFFLGMTSCYKVPLPPANRITSIESVTHTTAIIRAEILEESMYSFSCGIVFAQHQQPTLDDSCFRNDPGTPFRIPLSGLEWNTTYYIRSYTENEGGVTYSEENQFTTDQVDLFVDPRDGNEYPEIQIFEQVWMGENMRYEIPGKFKTVKNESGELQEEIYGLLYPMEVCQDVCPSGWHLPTDEDWKNLEYEVGVPNSQLDSNGYRGADAGFAVREPGEEHWYFDNDLITNTSGFTALPAGLYGESGYSGYGRRTFFWTAPDDSGTYYIRTINDQYFESNRGIQRNSKDISPDDLTTHYSVRCIKDN